MLENSNGFILNKVIITSLTSTSIPLEIKNLVAGIYLNECLTSSFIIGRILISDSAGFINSFRIEGGEKVEIEFTIADGLRNIKQNFNFRVYNISERGISDQSQVYNLELITEEAMLNEITKVYELLSGNPRDIIRNLLSKNIQSSKQLYAASGKFDMKFTGNGRTPFNIISSILEKSVPSQNSFNDDGKRGTSGFYFWESKRGYNFYSVDTLCDNEGIYKEDSFRQVSWGPYKELNPNAEGVDTKRIIMKAEFRNENDMMRSLRLGKFSIRNIFFNLNTGQYDESIYSLKTTYDNMTKLGKQKNFSSFPVAGVQLSNTPSRVMASYLDHEVYYNSNSIASPEPQDGSLSPNPFSDRHRYYATQSIFRYQLMRNQTLTLLIPGNLEMSAGDKIEVLLRNKVSASQLVRQPWDTESSGEYLIEEVSHELIRNSPEGGEYHTTLSLLRDSHGFKTSRYGEE